MYSLFNEAKKISAHRTTRQLPNREAFDKALEAMIYTPIEENKTLFGKTGFIAPIPETEALTYGPDDAVLICIREAKRVIDPEELNNRVQRRISQMEDETGSAVNKKMKQQICEEVTAQMLPDAKIHISDLFVILDITQEFGRIYALSNSAKTVDMAFAVIRRALGSFPVIPVATENPPETIMTQWLRDKDTNHKQIVVGASASIKGLTDKSEIKLKNVDLFSDEVRKHIEEENRYVVKLAVDFNKADDSYLCSFTLDEYLGLSGVNYDDTLKAAGWDEETTTAKWGTDHALLVGALNEVYDTLIVAFGGILKPKE